MDSRSQKSLNRGKGNRNSVGQNTLDSEDRPTERAFKGPGSRNSIPSDSRVHLKTDGDNNSSVRTIVSVNKRKPEHHKKTMLKVMDPNVHQMNLVHNEIDNSDDERLPTASDLMQAPRSVILRGTREPKIEMKRRIARQNDLI